MKSLGHKHEPENWRLFIVVNKHSLITILLHNGNEYPSIPTAHSTNMNKCYDVMKFLFEKQLQII